jgi:hypothetical protein
LSFSIFVHNNGLPPFSGGLNRDDRSGRRANHYGLQAMFPAAQIARSAIGTRAYHSGGEALIQYVEKAVVAAALVFYLMRGRRGG